MERLAIFVLLLVSPHIQTIYTAEIHIISDLQSLTEQDTLVSSDGTFELGFFTPGSSGNRYLGSWYKKISVKTMVWVANRSHPLTVPSSGVLRIVHPGNLVLMDNITNGILWSSNTTSSGNATAKLDDIGNLVMTDGDNKKILWQSFDYPSDTLLSGMKFGRDLLTGREWHLSSWKSSEDPAPGEFTYSIDTHGYPQDILKQGADVKFRAGPWNDKTQSTLLHWTKRFHIIEGIARGLLYLHQDSRLRIIHRDLKASNILLDVDMNPNISDFGIARSFGGNETQANTDRVVGTYGYMPPEYALDGIFSTKSDVFSFGVLVLEIVSGSRNRGFVHTKHDNNLIGHAWRMYNEGRSMELVDSTLDEPSDSSEVLRSIEVGLLCVQQSPEDRPNMSSVVRMLATEGAVQKPKQPAFFTERKFHGADFSSSTYPTSSTNDLTVTEIVAR